MTVATQTADLNRWPAKLLPYSSNASLAQLVEQLIRKTIHWHEQAQQAPQTLMPPHKSESLPRHKTLLAKINSIAGIAQKVFRKKSQKSFFSCSLASTDYFSQ